MLESELQLRALRDEEERTTQKIHQLQTIIASDTTSLVQRSKAQVELSRLQRLPKKTRESLVNFSDRGVVTKTKAQVEKDIRRIEERRKREDELLTKIKKLKEEFRNGGAANNHRSAERKKQLEEQLRVVGEEIEALELEKERDDDEDAFFTNNTSDNNNNNKKQARVRWTKIKQGLSSLVKEDNEEMIQMMEEQEKESEERIRKLEFCMAKSQRLLEIEEDYSDDDKSANNDLEERNNAGNDLFGELDKVQVGGIAATFIVLVLWWIEVPMIGVIIHALGIIWIISMLGQGGKVRRVHQ